MKQFRLVDNVLGWLSFLIAAFVYCSNNRTDSLVLGLSGVYYNRLQDGNRSPAGGPILHADGKSVLAVCQRPDTSCEDGQHHECPAVGDMYTVPVLEHHPP